MKRNAMSEMKRNVDALKELRESTLDAARPPAVEAQNALGKLTARARNDLLFDRGSFFEYGQLASAQNIPDRETPADRVIVGLGRVDGCPVAVINYDFDNVIDPRDTRPTLIAALRLLTAKDPHLPPKKHGINPFRSYAMIRPVVDGSIGGFRCPCRHPSKSAPR
jgi:acetyl-CoA carboxylase carboxyltransferase component